MVILPDQFQVDGKMTGMIRLVVDSFLSFSLYIETIGERESRQQKENHTDMYD